MEPYNIKTAAEIAVAGHVCLDVIPAFLSAQPASEPFYRPGALVEVGNAVMSTGGTVSNSGLALYRLGAHVRLIGKVGNDVFGQAVLASFQSHNPHLARFMIQSDDVPTSYSVVLNPPGRDRMFLHCPGANDGFEASEITDDLLEGVDMLHFGYPPLMKKMYDDGGLNLAKRLKEIADSGVLVSLDMAMPDPGGASGKVDWKAWLEHVLPAVDLYCPSVDETAAMLLPADKYRWDMEPALYQIRAFSETLLKMGAGIVLLKLGENGLYLRTSTTVTGRFPGDPEIWRNRELLAPCFQVNVQGTTGAGDTTVAGFLAAVAAGEDPNRAMISGVAAGACCVEASDGTSSIPTWENLHTRIEEGWRQAKPGFDLSGWSQTGDMQLWSGPADSRG